MDSIPTNEFIEFRKNIFNKFKIDETDIMSALQIIDINVTEICTRKCVFCPRSDAKVYPNRNLNMSINTCEKLANDLAEFDYKNQVVFAGFSEPLANKQIFKIIKTFRDKLKHNNNISITTNGDLLSKETLIGLFENGLDLLKMSLYDGPEQEEQFLKLFDECGITSDQYIIKRFWFGPEEEYGMSGISNRVGMMKLNDKAVPTRPCYMSFNSSFIDWNGDVLLCTHNWRKDVKFGNIHDTTLKNIWLSEAAKTIRQHHIQSGRKGISPCTNCEVHGQVYGEKSFNLFKSFYN